MIKYLLEKFDHFYSNWFGSCSLCKYCYDGPFQLYRIAFCEFNSERPVEFFLFTRPLTLINMILLFTCIQVSVKVVRVVNSFVDKEKSYL